MNETISGPPASDPGGQGRSIDEFLANPLSAPAAWAQLLEEFRPYLLNIAQAEFPRELSPRLGPSDLVQMTLTIGHLRPDAFSGDTRGDVAHWLRQILRNQLQASLREHQREKRRISREVTANHDLVDLGRPSPSAQALSQEERGLLEAALSRLPDHYRQVVLWRQCDDLPFLEIGRRLGRTDEAARKLWTRALQKLQQELGVRNAE